MSIENYREILKCIVLYKYVEELINYLTKLNLNYIYMDLIDDFWQ